MKLFRYFQVILIYVDAVHQIPARFKASFDGPPDISIALHYQISQQLQHLVRECLNFQHFDEDVVNEDGADVIVVGLAAKITVSCVDKKIRVERFEVFRILRSKFDLKRFETIKIQFDTTIECLVSLTRLCIEL